MALEESEGVVEMKSEQTNKTGMPISTLFGRAVLLGTIVVTSCLAALAYNMLGVEPPDRAWKAILLSVLLHVIYGAYTVVLMWACGLVEWKGKSGG